MRNKIRVVCIALASLLVIAGCGNSDEEKPGVGGAAKRGGTMVIPLGADPPTLNGAIQSGPQVLIPASPILEGLLTVDATGETVPVLAESWDVSDDGLQYVFHLRTGVTWHDGEPFTSEDVRFTIEEALPLRPGGTILTSLISSLEVPDDVTVQIELTHPSPLLLNLLSPNTAPIIPAHIYDDTDLVTNPANLAPIGTGPFKFSEWKPGERIVLVRNDDYWEEGKPYLDSLIFPIIPDSTTRLNALLAGEADMLPRTSIDMRTLSQMESSDRIDVREGTGESGMRPIYFNSDHPPLNDAEVRKALIQAIDRHAMVDSIWDGHAEAGRTSLPQNYEQYFNPEVDYDDLFPFDLKAAADRLDELGYTADADGVRFSLDYVYTNEYFGTGELGEIMKANFDEIGVKLNLVQQEVQVYGQTVFPQRDYDLASNILGSRTDPAIGVDPIFRCNEHPEVLFTNPTDYCNPELEDLLDLADKTLDEAERIGYYQQAQEIIAEDMPTLLVLSEDIIDVISTRIGGADAFFNTLFTATAPEWEELWVA